MLGKLMKYEWKAIWKVLTIINAFTVFVTILGVITMNLIVTDNNVMSDDFLGIIIVLMFMLYYATIIGVSFAITIYTGMRFYKNLYTDEGYLMHTLPVTKWQLILSKLTIHTLASCITQILVLCSIGALLLPLFAVLLEDPTFSVSYLWTEFSNFCKYELEVSIFGFVLFCTIATVIGIISSTLFMYGAISLGQTFQKHKVMGSILCYIGIYCLLQTINTILMMPQMLLHVGTMDTSYGFMEYMNNILLTSSVSSIITGIIFYFITSYIMSKKLNLD